MSSFINLILRLRFPFCSCSTTATTVIPNRMSGSLVLLQCPGNDQSLIEFHLPSFKPFFDGHLHTSFIPFIFVCICLIQSTCPHHLTPKKYLEKLSEQDRQADADDTAQDYSIFAIHASRWRLLWLASIQGHNTPYHLSLLTRWIWSSTIAFMGIGGLGLSVRFSCLCNPSFINLRHLTSPAVNCTRTVRLKCLHHPHWTAE